MEPSIKGLYVAIVLMTLLVLLNVVLTLNGLSPVRELNREFTATVFSSLLRI